VDAETRAALQDLRQLMATVLTRLTELDAFVRGDIATGRVGAAGRLQDAERKSGEHGERLEELEERVGTLERAPAQAALSMWERFLHALVAAGAGGLAAWLSTRIGGH
jgi:hypothetical protein